MIRRRQRIGADVRNGIGCAHPCTSSAEDRCDRGAAYAPAVPAMPERIQTRRRSCRGKPLRGAVRPPPSRRPVAHVPAAAKPTGEVGDGVAAGVADAHPQHAPILRQERGAGDEQGVVPTLLPATSSLLRRRTGGGSSRRRRWSTAARSRLDGPPWPPPRSARRLSRLCHGPGVLSARRRRQARPRPPPAPMRGAQIAAQSMSLPACRGSAPGEPTTAPTR